MASSPTRAMAAVASWRRRLWLIQPKRLGRLSRNRFSATVSVGSRFSSCMTMRTPRRSASLRLPGA
ncbi:hypothetical protein D9M73_149300 [compost metagenome]